MKHIREEVMQWYKTHTHSNNRHYELFMTFSTVVAMILIGLKLFH